MLSHQTKFNKFTKTKIRANNRMKPETTDENWTICEYIDINQHNTDSQVSQRRNPKGS